MKYNQSQQNMQEIMAANSKILKYLILMIVCTINMVIQIFGIRASDSFALTIYAVLLLMSTIIYIYNMICNLRIGHK